jgi:hypothetical protein
MPGYSLGPMPFRLSTFAEEMIDPGSQFPGIGGEPGRQQVGDVYPCAVCVEFVCNGYQLLRSVKKKDWVVELILLILQRKKLILPIQMLIRLS